MTNVPRGTLLGKDTDQAFYPLPLQDSGTSILVKAGGFSLQVNTTLSIHASTAAYASGDLFGTLITISGPARLPGLGGLIQHFSVEDKANLKPSLDVVFFNQNPASTTFTDNATLDIDDNDLNKIAGILHISDWTSFNDNAYGQDKDANLRFNLSVTVNTLYYAMVIRNVASYVATSDITAKLNILQD